MNQKELFRRKLEYATPEEVLFLFLNDTDKKFKRAIDLWEESNSEAQSIVSKVHDNILELKVSLNTDIGDEQTQKALRCIHDLYDFIINETIYATIKNDVNRFKGAYDIFLEVKDIFEQDRKNSM